MTHEIVKQLNEAKLHQKCVFDKGNPQEFIDKNRHIFDKFGWVKILLISALLTGCASKYETMCFNNKAILFYNGIAVKSKGECK